MNYSKYRSDYFRDQGGAETYEKVEFRGSQMADGSPLNAVYLQPRKNIFLHDVWHCPDPATAKEVIYRICRFEDITHLELKHKWVWVKHTHKGEGTSELEGQKHDPRDKVTGRS